MRRVFALALLAALAGCRAMPSTPAQDFFVVFFVPDTTELSPEAQQIVRQASANAMGTTVNRIEIAVPRNRVELIEGRFTAIQNILSASGISPTIFARVPVSEMAASLPGAADRAEIHLISTPSR